MSWTAEGEILFPKEEHPSGGRRTLVPPNVAMLIHNKGRYPEVERGQLSLPGHALA